MFAAVEKLLWNNVPSIDTNLEVVKVNQFRLSEILPVNVIEAQTFDCSRITKAPSTIPTKTVWVKIRKLIAITRKFEFIEFSFLPMRPDFVTVTQLIDLDYLDKLEYKKDYTGTLVVNFNDSAKTNLQYIMQDMRVFVEEIIREKKNMKLKEDAEKRILVAIQKEEEFDLLPSIELGSIIMFQFEEALDMLSSADKTRYEEIAQRLRSFRKRLLDFQESLAVKNASSNYPYRHSSTLSSADSLYNSTTAKPIIIAKASPPTNPGANSFSIGDDEDEAEGEFVSIDLTTTPKDVKKQISILTVAESHVYRPNIQSIVPDEPSTQASVTLGDISTHVNDCNDSSEVAETDRHHELIDEFQIETVSQLDSDAVPGATNEVDANLQFQGRYDARIGTELSNADLAILNSLETQQADLKEDNNIMNTSLTNDFDDFINSLDNHPAELSNSVETTGKQASSAVPDLDDFLDSLEDNQPSAQITTTQSVEDPIAGGGNSAWL